MEMGIFNLGGLNMSRFYGNLTNDRSTITKCGHNDGLVAHIRGWNLGIRVESYINKKGKD